MFDEMSQFIRPTEPNSAYKEIWRLEHLLDEKKISHSIQQLFDGYRVGVIYGGLEIGDAIEHKGSYGHENDLLEIRGFDVNDVIGSLTADEVMQYVNKSLMNWSKYDECN